MNMRQLLTKHRELAHLIFILFEKDQFDKVCFEQVSDDDKNISIVAGFMKEMCCRPLLRCVSTYSEPGTSFVASHTIRLGLAGTAPAAEDLLLLGLLNRLLGDLRKLGMDL